MQASNPLVILSQGFILYQFTQTLDKWVCATEIIIFNIV